MQAKLPVGKGVWPAFWLLGRHGDPRPEIDIMEAYPGGGPDSGWGDANLHPVPMFVLLDLWFGSASGTPDATTPTGEGNAYEVRYVRVWQLKTLP